MASVLNRVKIVKPMMKSRITHRYAIPLLLLFGFIPGCGTAQENSPDAITSSKPAASSPEEIQGRWWTWVAAEIENTNPVADTTGRLCDRNQPRDVWFLAGTFGGVLQRTCKVPAQRPVVFPLVNHVGSKVTCEQFMATADGEATLDGKSVTSERMEGDNVAVTGVAGNPLTGEEGTVIYSACGIWVRLQPLQPGRHRLIIRGSSGNFHTGVDYTLVVGSGQGA